MVYLQPHTDIGSLRTVVRKIQAANCVEKQVLVLEDFVSAPKQFQSKETPSKQLEDTAKALQIQRKAF